jgi:hypothetical protein
LQSQVNKAAKKRLSLSGLEVLHGRLISRLASARAFLAAVLSCLIPTREMRLLPGI